LLISWGVIRSQLILYFLVLLSDIDSFFVYLRVVERCPWFAVFVHCRSPVNFQSSANGLEVVKVQACLLYSCIVERINSIRGEGYEFIWLISFRNEYMLFSVDSNRSWHTLSLVFPSSAMCYTQCRC
jgi:hypothetical protein